MIRVDLVDPPAYSPPYDHALASALGRAGAEVRLVTSRFAYAEALEPDGYSAAEAFYLHARGAPGSRLRTLTKAAEHLPDMLRYRRAAAIAADVVHFQWLTLPQLDLRLLPDRPTVLTIHDPMARGLVDRLAPPARLIQALPAVIVHTEAAHRALTGHGLDPGRVHVIPHGAFTHLTALAATAALPAELTAGSRPRKPTALYFGLIRPYKGLETLLEAWRGIADAELWVVGRPLFDVTPLKETAPPSVRFVERFVSDSEAAALYDNADVVVLPYARGARFGFSGVLASALGFGKPAVVSDVDGFAEALRLKAARAVPAGDAPALHAVLQQLLADPEEREKLAKAARAAAAGPYSWDRVAAATLKLYETIRR